MAEEHASKRVAKNNADSLDKNDQNSPSSEEDDFVGPAIPEENSKLSKKRKRRLKHEKLYLSNLPDYERYTLSFMHKNVVTVVAVQPSTGDDGFLISGDSEGYIKFWKKTSRIKLEQENPVVFVKQFLAHHHEPIIDAVFSTDGKYLATISRDKTSKIFDVENFDMINILEFNFIPKAISWVGKNDSSTIIVSEDGGTKIYVFDARSEESDEENSRPLQVLKLHRSTVNVLEYNPVYDCVISSDASGMVEYWTPSGDYNKPANVFELKSSTNLYDFKKSKTFLTSIAISPDGTKFAALSAYPHRKISIFDFVSAKKLKEYDESLDAITEMQQFGTSAYKPDDIEFGKRLSVEKDLELVSKDIGDVRARRMCFDISGNYILYSTLLGIKLVNLMSNSCTLLYGKEESDIRFLNVALYQGNPNRKNIMTVEMATSDNALLSKTINTKDPVIFATAYNKNRFYLFTRFTGDFESIKSSRNVHNETSVKSEPTKSSNKNVKTLSPMSSSSVTLHTSKGDITIKLFPEHTPLAVENFVTHCKNGYYDNLIFHRVIKKFMIQGGDPLGDGTGGSSIWGKSFEDEFTPSLRHDRPFTISMANAGKNTNGSQFFITTEATPWLDDKHTIFGRVTGGMEVVKSIEALPTNKQDRPDDPPYIISASL